MRLKIPAALPRKRLQKPDGPQKERRNQSPTRVRAKRGSLRTKSKTRPNHSNSLRDTGGEQIPALLCPGAFSQSPDHSTFPVLRRAPLYLKTVPEFPHSPSSVLNL